VALDGIPATDKGAAPVLRTEGSPMRIETIIPTLNNGADLKRAVGSALDQRDVESQSITVVDNGSIDHSVEDMLALYEGRVRVIQCQERGEAAARNAALDIANAPVIAFLDADDLWHPDHLSSAISVLQTKAGPTIYSALARRIDQDGHLLSVSPRPRTGKNWGTKLLGRNRVVASGVVISGAPLARFPKLQPCADLGLWLRLFVAGFELISGTKPTVDYTVTPRRYPARHCRKAEWVLYRELVASHSIARRDEISTLAVLCVDHARSRIR
jgi:glycosyltransferase involved in cell wall biosynthesis